MQLQLFFFCPPTHNAQALFNQLAGIRRLGLQCHLAGFDLGHVEDVVDQLQQVLATIEDVLCIALVSLVSERAEHFTQHDFRETVDGVEWCAQFMAHIGQEFTLGAIGFLGANFLDFVFLGKIGDMRPAGFQIVDSPAQLGLIFRQRSFMTLEVRDVGTKADQAAISGGAFRIVKPATIGQLDFVGIHAIGLAMHSLDGAGGSFLDHGIGEAGFEVAIPQIEEVTELSVPQHQAPPGIP